MLWDFSARARIADGAPTTPFATAGAFYGRPDPLRYAEGPRRTRFFSTDLRAERTFATRGSRRLVVYGEMVNVTGRHNWYAEEWSPYDRALFPETTLGRLPNVGIDWKF